MSYQCYGPLAGLIGTWKGDKGIDIAPEPDGEENNPYYETICITVADDVSNAETQQVYALHYRQLVQRKSNDRVFHDQTGYWMWDADSATVMHGFNIPRAVNVLAGGVYTPDDGDAVELRLTAALDHPDWKIIESPFMRDNASSKSFEQLIRIQGDEMYYEQTTIVDIYGKRFEHTDQNTLHKIS